MQFSTVLISSLAIFVVSAAPTPGNGYGGGGSGGGGSGDGSGGNGGGDGSGGSGGGGSGNGGSSGDPPAQCPSSSQQVCCNTEEGTSTLSGLLAPINLSQLLPIGCGLGVAGSGSCTYQVGCCENEGEDQTCSVTNNNGVSIPVAIDIPINIPGLPINILG